MKDIKEYITESNVIELTVKCVKDLDTKYHNFKVGENGFVATKINDNWWLIDSIGISGEDFKKHFKENNETN